MRYDIAANGVATIALEGMDHRLIHDEQLKRLSDTLNEIVTYHNPLDNVEQLAHHFFKRCFQARVMPIVSTNMLLALEANLPTVPPADHPPQAIVVLSAEMIRTHQETLGFRPGLLSLDRLRTAAMMHRRPGLPILVSGGDAQPDSPALADVLAQSLNDDFQTQARWVEAKDSDDAAAAKWRR